MCLDSVQGVGYSVYVKQSKNKTRSFFKTCACKKAGGSFQGQEHNYSFCNSKAQKMVNFFLTCSKVQTFISNYYDEKIQYLPNLSQ